MNYDQFKYFLINWLKEQHLFKIEMFCNILHDVTVTFVQFNTSLVNTILKYIYIYIYIFLKPNFAYIPW